MDKQLKYEFVRAVNAHGIYEIPAVYFQRHAAKCLLKGKIHEPRTINFIRNRAGKASAVSGGAFVGDFLPGMPTALAEGEKLITFEPNPLSSAAAQRTIALNALANVEITNAAVGSLTGEGVLEVSLSGVALEGASRIVSDDPSLSAVPVGETLPIRIVTIDPLVAAGKRISILHLAP